MIAYLKGTLFQKGEGWCVVLAGNVGYRVWVLDAFLHESNIGEEVSFYISHYIREDTSDLYGFRQEQERALFDRLLAVSGVGPKTALGVLQVASVSAIIQAISQGNPDLLKQVAGIGTKTAERIVVELKAAFKGGAGVVGESGGSGAQDVVDALISLGYSSGEARAALAKIPSSVTESADRLRQALKYLGVKPS